MVNIYLVEDRYIAQIYERFLGTRCPLCGQWMPAACSLAAHCVFTDSPSRVYGENSHWTEILDAFL